MKSEHIISSGDLCNPGEEVRLGAESGLLDVYDGLKTPYSSDLIRLSDEHIRQIEGFATKAIVQYGPSDESGRHNPEQTYVQKEHGVPTLLGRVDCTISPLTGQIVPYELEDSPSGLGITDILHKAAGAEGIRDLVRSHFRDVLGTLPFVIVSGARNHGTDDPLIVGPENYSYSKDRMHTPLHLEDSQPVIVKAIPGQLSSLTPYLALQDRSVCTMTSEGDKTYTRRIGICQEVHNVEEAGLDINRLPSVVIKRALGSMAMGVKVHLHASDKAIYGNKGTVKAGKLMRQLEEYIAEDGVAYIQDFQGPIRISNPEQRGNMILRIFTLIEPAGKTGSDIQAQVIGGCYVARPELVVHGATNAVGGAVLV